MNLVNIFKICSENQFSLSDGVSISVAVISLIVAIIALVKTSVDIKERRVNDFINTVFTHLNCIQSIYNDCLLIIDDRSIDESVDFLNIEKELLSEFNFLYYYGCFKENEILKEFSTMTNINKNKSFAYVFLNIEDKYKQFRNSLSKNGISDEDIEKLREYLVVINNLNDLVHTYIKTVLYDKNLEQYSEYLSKLEEYALSGEKL